MAFGGIPTPGLRPRKDGQRDERLEACGRTVAFVVALGPYRVSDVVPAVEAARHSGTAGTFVLASPERAQSVLMATLRMGGKGRSMVQAVEYDDSMMPPDDREPFGLPCHLVQSMRAIAESTLDEYDAVVVLDADVPDITSRQVAEYCAAAKKLPEGEGPDPGEAWSRREPLRIPRVLLEAY